MPLFLIALFALFCLFLSTNDIGIYPIKEFRANESKYKALMNENFEKFGTYKWAHIPNESPFAAPSNTFVYIIEMNSDQLAEIIQKRNKLDNPSPLSENTKRPFEIPFHFACQYSASEIEKDISIIIQTC